MAIDVENKRQYEPRLPMSLFIISLQDARYIAQGVTRM
jgi:hypothetical protein